MFFDVFSKLMNLPENMLLPIHCIFVYHSILILKQKIFFLVYEYKTQLIRNIAMGKYLIKDLEHFSGIKAHTIRIWEKRYGLLDPNRTDTNIRYYSDDDVKKILNVAMLVKNGHKISNVASLSESTIRTEVLKVSQQSNDTDKNIDQLLYHAVNLDSFGFERLLDELILAFGFKKMIEQIAFPFFERIGVLWQTGSIFVAHEHFVSNLLRSRLISETTSFKNEKTEKSILFFLREGEWHELGLLYYNYLAAQAGTRCIYLGQSLPFGDLSAVLETGKYDMLCTAFIHSIDKAGMEDYLSNLSQIFSRGKLLIFGRQVSINRPKLPANVAIVKNGNDFLRKIDID